MLEAAGELKTIKGAERESEIGGIVDIYQRTPGSPAVMFDDVPGYPAGYRVVANILTSVRRINLTIGLGPTTGGRRDGTGYASGTYMKEAKTIPPLTVEGGPLTQNAYSGADINLLKIPTPRWHEHDGGYYIGTGCMVIMKDPDSGWINYGAYRIQVHDRNVASVMTSRGQARQSSSCANGTSAASRARSRWSVGMHQALFIGRRASRSRTARTSTTPPAASSRRAGPRSSRARDDGYRSPAQRRGRVRGLRRPEGSRSTRGRSASGPATTRGGLKKEPRIRVESFWHRDQPILLGAIPAMPPNDDTFYRGTYRCGAVWQPARGGRRAGE